MAEGSPPRSSRILLDRRDGALGASVATAGRDHRGGGRRRQRHAAGPVHPVGRPLPAGRRGAAGVARRGGGRGRVRGRSRARPGARSMAQSAGVMREMGKRTGEIGGIVDTINLIAERTNLLSLNASIEAARAGEAGRGFAVVAEEIRNLADRAAQATADIAAIIRALQEVAQEAVAASGEGVKVADESGQLAEDGHGRAEEDPRRRRGNDRRRRPDRPRDRRTASAGQTVVTAVSTPRQQARQWPPATAEQTKAAQDRPGDRADAEDRPAGGPGDGRAGPGGARHHQGRPGHPRLAEQVRKATGEQAGRARPHIPQAIEAMRRESATTTSRALAEQSSAADQIARTAEGTAKQIAAVSAAVRDQSQSSARSRAARRRCGSSPTRRRAP